MVEVDHQIRTKMVALRKSNNTIDSISEDTGISTPYVDINKIWDDDYVQNVVVTLIPMFKAKAKGKTIKPIEAIIEPRDNFIFFIVSKEGSKKGLNQFKSPSEIFESLTQVDPSPSKSNSKKVLEAYIKGTYQSHEEYLSTFYISRRQFNKNGLMVTDILPLDQW